MVYVHVRLGPISIDTSLLTRGPYQLAGFLSDDSSHVPPCKSSQSQHGCLDWSLKPRIGRLCQIIDCRVPSFDFTPGDIRFTLILGLNMPLVSERISSSFRRVDVISHRFS